MFNIPKIFFLSYFVLLFFFCRAEEEKKDLIQFSGVVVSSDGLSGIPYTSIIIKNSHRGTMTDFYGFFSLVAQESDTVEFVSLGYKNASYIIPDSLSSSRYSLIQTLKNDTIVLPEAVIYPWPTKEQFKQAFMNLNVANDDYERARKNLARATIQNKMKGTKMDGSENSKYTLRQHQSRLYNAGRLRSIDLINPIAWAEFVKAWKNGDLKIE